MNVAKEYKRGLKKKQKKKRKRKKKKRNVIRRETRENYSLEYVSGPIASNYTLALDDCQDIDSRFGPFHRRVKCCIRGN